MRHLYNGNEGSSQEVCLLQRTNPVMWSYIRGEAIKLLAGSLYDDSAKTALEKLPLELWDATNGFGDSFQVLYMKVTVADFLRLAREAERSSEARMYRGLAEAMEAKGTKVRFITMEPLEESAIDVDTPGLRSTSATVELALENLDTLLQHSTQGAVSAVDRIHTAIHGHLLHLCTAHGLTPNANLNLDALFSLLRGGSPVQNAQSDTIFRGLSKVIHALSPARNESSLAHPNEDLLDEPEAKLVVNAGRTLLRYLDSRFAK